MSMTPLRSLKAIVVVAGLVIAQGSVLSGQSSPVHAATGTNIQLYNNVYQSTAGIATTLTVVGSGFTPSSYVNVIFNAAVGNNNSAPHVHATPPILAGPPWVAPGDTPAAPGINGDVIEGGIGPTTAPAANTQNNSIAVLVRTDAGGNLIDSVPQTQTTPVVCNNTTTPANLCAGAPAIINVSASAAPGRYAITAIDNSVAVNSATTAYTLTPNTTPGLSVLPAAPSLYNGVALGGSLNVTIANGSEPANAVVQFALDDFLASHNGGGGFANGTPGIGPQFTLLGAAVPLRILDCGGSTSFQPGPTFTTPPAFIGGGVTACVASAAGGLTAQVQLKTDNGGSTSITTLGATPAELAFPDGVYTLVALSDQQQTSATATTAAYTTPGPLTRLFAGVKLDHTTPRISLSSGQSAPSGSVRVLGYGFAANSQVNIIFGSQQVPLQGTGISPNFPTGPGCAFSLTNNTYNGFYTAGTKVGGLNALDCTLTPNLMLTDSTGSFNAVVTLPGSSIASTAPGVILAEDFDNTTPNAPTLGQGARLNASAIAPLTMSGGNPAPTLTLSPDPAAVGSTVIFTGTGYTPFESVTVWISDSATGCVSTNVATVQAGAALTPGGTANVNGSFVVPTNACTAVATAAGTKNAGVTATVTATGAQSGLANSVGLVIPQTLAVITLVSPAYAEVTGTGFAADEPVSFTLAAVRGPATLMGSTDVNGKVTVYFSLPTGASTGPLSVTATGLTSGFTATGMPLTVPATSSVTVTNLAGNGFAVTFTTALPASVTLLYGTSAGALTSTAFDDRDGSGPAATQSTVHRFTLSGLTAGTTYYFEPSVLGVPQPAAGGPYSQVLPTVQAFPPLPHQMTGSVLRHDGSVPAPATVLLTGYWTNPDGSRSLPVSVLDTAAVQNLNYTIAASPLNQAGTDYFALTVGSSVFHVSGTGDDGGQLGSGGPVTAVLASPYTAMPEFSLSPFVTFTFHLQAGWNLISLPLTPTSPLDAQTVLTTLLAQTHGGYAEIDSYSSGQFTPSMFADPGGGLPLGGTNFTLQVGHGYALYTDTTGTLAVTGTTAGAQTVTLATGWNLVGFPDAAANPVQAYSFLTALLAQTHGGYAEIDAYTTGQFTPSAFADPGGGLPLGGTNFTVQAGQGYALYTDVGTTQTL